MRYLTIAAFLAGVAFGGCAPAGPRLELGPMVFERSLTSGEYAVVALQEGRSYVLEVRTGRIAVEVTPDRPGTPPPLVTSHLVGLRVQPSATADYRLTARGRLGATDVVQLRELVSPADSAGRD